jgi:hypothetical protein
METQLELFHQYRHGQPAQKQILVSQKVAYREAVA